MEHAIRLRVVGSQVRQFRRRGGGFSEKRRLAPPRPAQNHRALPARIRRLYLYNEENLDANNYLFFNYVLTLFILCDKLTESYKYRVVVQPVDFQFVFF